MLNVSTAKMARRLRRSQKPSNSRHVDSVVRAQSDRNDGDDYTLVLDAVDQAIPGSPQLDLVITAERAAQLIEGNMRLQQSLAQLCLELLLDRAVEGSPLAQGVGQEGERVLRGFRPCQGRRCRP